MTAVVTQFLDTYLHTFCTYLTSECNSNKLLHKQKKDEKFEISLKQENHALDYDLLYLS